MALADGDQPLATAARLEATGIDYDVARHRGRRDRVTLQKPWAQIERAADGCFPLRALLEPPAPDGGALPAGRAA